MEKKYKITFGIIFSLLLVAIGYGSIQSDSIITTYLLSNSADFNNVEINATANDSLVIYSLASSTIMLQMKGTDPALEINSSSTGVPIKLNSNISIMSCNSANEGSIYYDGTAKLFYGCNSTVWNELG